MEPVFPADLEREIFEIAATMHPREIPVLLQVARRVLVWIEPFLYRVIRVDHWPTVDAVRRAMHTKPASFFRDNVRHLFLGFCRFHSKLSEEEAHTLLRLCSGIVSFSSYCWDHSESALLPILEGIPKARRWAGSLQDLFGSRSAIDLTHSFFDTITHLDMFEVLTSGSDDVRICAGLAALPALSHLCLNEGIEEAVLRCMLEQCARLQVLVNLWHSSETKLARKIANNPPATDERFVVCVFGDYWADWEVGARGGTDFWAAADAFVAKKRRGEIQASCYLLERWDP
ncbi:hypothetical protein DFH09DRAFT_57007 [Mycena vulgaris]|nr:hypothetical protein DFH09DRAFT_57007 [Mycena vulgaris]